MRITIAALALSAALPLLADDLTITQKVTSDGGTPTTTTSYLSSDHVRMTQGDGKDMIVNFKTGDMTVIDTNKKEYYVITRADMDAMSAKMKEMMNSPEMKQAQERMNNLPPEQKAKMEAMMGGMFAVDIHKTGASRKIAGYNCDVWSVSIGAFSKSEECITNELKFPAQAWDMYKSYADSMRTMMASMGPMAKSAEKMAEQFKQMKGFPIANTSTTDIMGRKSTHSTEVTSVKHGAVPASAWEIPAGYTKVDNPMMKQMDRMGNRHR